MHNGIVPGQLEGQQPPQQGQHNEANANATSVDDLINSAAQQSSQAQTQATPTPAPAPAPTESAKATPAKDEEAPKKKDKKGKPTRLIYSDENVSPEEKMAGLPKYAYTPPRDEPTALGPVEAAVTGVQQGPDDVRDAVQG